MGYFSHRTQGEMRFEDQSLFVLIFLGLRRVEIKIKDFFVVVDSTVENIAVSIRRKQEDCDTKSFRKIIGWVSVSIYPQGFVFEYLSMGIYCGFIETKRR